VPSGRLKLINGTTESILPGVTAVKTGGHFDGSLVLHWEKKLFIADTFVTVPVSFPSPLTKIHSATSALQAVLLTHRLRTVGAVPHKPPTRHNQLLLHVVDPEHDPPPAERDAKDVEGPGTI
jgi:glyoxylase-like metal-dependent hydrolase (beta-lactamase superfamily II)